MFKPGTLPSKIGMTIFALLFGGIFTVGGIFAGIVPFFDQTSGWWAARSFVAVPAQVSAVELETLNDGEGGPTHRVNAQFNYRFEGRDYVGHNVGLSKIFDNLSDYHYRTHARLKQAQDQGQSVQIWVNPRQPAVSVYDRDMRWQTIIFHIPFMILFPAVGVGALWAIYVMWFHPPAAPRRLMPGTRVKAEASGALALFFASMFWNLISFPIAAMVVHGVMRGQSKAGLLVLLFPIVGLGLLAGTLATLAKRRRVGHPELVVRGTAPLRARIEFAPPLGERLSPSEMRHEVVVDVLLVKDKGSGEDDEPTTLWEANAVRTRLARGSTSLDFQSDVAQPDAADIGIEVHLKTAGAVVIFKLPREPLGRG